MVRREEEDLGLLALLLLFLGGKPGLPQPPTPPPPPPPPPPEPVTLYLTAAEYEEYKVMFGHRIYWELQPYSSTISLPRGTDVDRWLWEFARGLAVANLNAPDGLLPELPSNQYRMGIHWYYPSPEEAADYNIWTVMQGHIYRPDEAISRNVLVVLNYIGQNIPYKLVVT